MASGSSTARSLPSVEDRTYAVRTDDSRYTPPSTLIPAGDTDLEGPRHQLAVEVGDRLLGAGQEVGRRLSELQPQLGEAAVEAGLVVQLGQPRRGDDGRGEPLEGASTPAIAARINRA